MLERKTHQEKEAGSSRGRDAFLGRVIGEKTYLRK